MEFKDIKKPELKSIKDTAEFIGVSLPTLYRMVKCGKIKATNIARSGSKKPVWAFAADDVQAYYDSFGKGGPEGDT